MKNFNINNFEVVVILNGLRLAERDAHKRYDEAKQEGERVEYYEMKLREAELVYAKMDVVWHKNNYDDAKRYAKDNERGKAELKVEKSRVDEANAKMSLAKVIYSEAEKAWLKA